MDSHELRGRMVADLFTSELSAQRAAHEVTNRGVIYLEGGLSLDEVLGALRVSRATWYRRVQALEDWRARNGAALRL